MFAELPLYIFTLLGGCAAGLYVVAAFFPSKSERPALMPIVALVLLAIGGVALLFHLGRPERMLLAFGNPAAGIAQEGYATVGFGVFLVIDLIISLTKKQSNRVVRIVAAVFAALLILAMGNAYMSYQSIPAWGSPITLVFFVCTALGIGAGLLPLLDGKALDGSKLGFCVVVLMALACVACIVEAVRFAMVGANCAMLVVGAVAAAVAAYFGFAASKEEAVSSKWTIAFALIAVAVVIGRLGFYLA